MTKSPSPTQPGACPRAALRADPWGLEPPSPALRERVLTPGSQSGGKWVRVAKLFSALLLGIAGAAAAEPPPGASSCSGCHPASLKVETPVPPIRGGDAAEITAAMEAFRSGERPSTVMGRIAKGFSNDEIQAIAAWLAQQH
jgi:sulfide dehydrogenase cytochrome subunit